MRLVLKQSETLLNKKINITKRVVPSFDVAWHYHKEFELLYISQSNGIRFVGDNVSPFFPGDLVLVGSNLPHLWRSDPSYYETNSTKNIKTIVTKFTKDFLGVDFFSNQQFYKIQKLLQASKYGLYFNREVSQSLHNEIMKLPDLSPIEQNIALLNILHKLSIVKEVNKTVLSSSDMRQSFTESSEKIDIVLKYISDNYATNINLEKVASVACMTTNSFCRFFKKTTTKTFTKLVNEYRVVHATKLLAESNMNIADISFECGFNNFSHFNKLFKEFTGKSASVYRSELKDLIQ